MTDQPTCIQMMRRASWICWLNRNSTDSFLPKKPLWPVSLITHCCRRDWSELVTTAGSDVHFSELQTNGRSGVQKLSANLHVTHPPVRTMWQSSQRPVDNWQLTNLLWSTPEQEEQVNMTVSGCCRKPSMLTKRNPQPTTQFYTFLPLSSPQYSTHSSHTLLKLSLLAHLILTSRLKFSDRSFLNAAPSLWNKLLITLRSLST